MADFLNTVKGIASKVLPSRKRVSQIVVASAAETAFKERQTTRQDFVVTPLQSAIAGMMLPGEQMIHKKTPSGHARSAWAMYFEDDRVRAVVDSIGEDAAQRGIDRKPFSINVKLKSSSESEELKEHFENLFSSRKVNVWNRVDRITRGFLNQGSIYYRKIISLTDPPTIVEWKLVKGPRNNFIVLPVESDDPSIAGGYVQYEMTTRQLVNFFFWWEIDAFHWRFDEESNSGLPLMSSGTTNWDRLNHIDRTLATARNYHAFKRILNKIEAVNADDFEKMIQSIENRDRQRGAQSPFSNYYTNKDASVLDQTMSWQIQDVNYAQDKLFNSGMMPKGLYGSGGANINRAVLDMQTQRYIDGTVMDAEATVQGGLETFVATELYLMGRTPEMTPVEFVWPPKHVIDSRMVTEAREAVNAGWLSIDSYLSYAFRTNFDREAEKLTQEAEKIAKMAKEREAAMEKDADNEDLNSDEDADIEIDDNDAEAEIEALHGFRNGRLKRILEAA
jgi:hypothetical protein